MSVFVALLVLVSSGNGKGVIPSVTVKGNIATRVVFKGTDGDKVAASCLTILAEKLCRKLISAPRLTTQRSSRPQIHADK